MILFTIIQLIKVINEILLKYLEDKILSSVKRQLNAFNYFTAGPVEISNEVKKSVSEAFSKFSYETEGCLEIDLREKVIEYIMRGKSQI